MFTSRRARGCERRQKYTGRRTCGHRLPRICSTRGCCSDVDAGTSRKPRGSTAPTPLGYRSMNGLESPGFSRGEDVKTLALTVFQGRAGDHNDRGFGGAAAIGAGWQRRLCLTAATVGTPEPPLSTDWREELTAAAP